MLSNITRKIYNLLLTILLPLLFLRLLIKSIKLAAYRQRWLERLGIFTVPAGYKHSNNIWIHAVSVGEIIASIPIIQKIQAQLPNFSIVLTCTTPAGSAIIKRILANQVFHVYFPFDVNFAIKNFLTTIQPKLLIIIEKEIWPNVILNCANNNIPVIIANAQLSNKSLRRYLLIKFLIRSCLRQITFICAQTKFDVYKLKKLLGSKKPDNITVTGNSKFDLAWQNSCNKSFVSENRKINHPIWIAASTHPIEEQLVLEAHKLILQRLPNTLLILAPRHTERSKEIAKNLADLNFTFKVHSHGSILLAANVNSIISNQIYLLDTIGELNALYSISQAAFVGGSLVPIGGHNVLEPASFGIPVAIGPYTANCQEIVFRIKLAQGLIKVKNAKDLSEIITQWLQDDNLRTTMGQNAKNYLYNQIGASDKIVNLAVNVLC